MSLDDELDEELSCPVLRVVFPALSWLSVLYDPFAYAEVVYSSVIENATSAKSPKTMNLETNLLYLICVPSFLFLGTNIAHPVAHSQKLF